MFSGDYVCVCDRGREREGGGGGERLQFIVASSGNSLMIFIVSGEVTGSVSTSVGTHLGTQQDTFLNITQSSFGFPQSAL